MISSHVNHRCAQGLVVILCPSLFSSPLMRNHKKAGDWPQARELVMLQVGSEMSSLFGEDSQEDSSCT